MKKRHLTKTVRIIIAGILFVFLIAFTYFYPAVRGLSQKANADSIDIYPAQCEGGWQSPSSAEGASDGASSVLNGVDAQLVCGSFQASDQSQQPLSVTLNLSWNVDFSGGTLASTTVSTDTDSSIWSTTLDASNTTPADTTSTDMTPSSTPSSTDDANQDVTIPTSTADTPVTTTTATTITTSTATTTATTSSTPSSTPSQDDQSTATGTSLLQSIFKDSLSFIIPPTILADEASDTSDMSGENFIDISYSVDGGATWQDLGPVNSADWQNYSVTIPVSSWSDINALEVEFTPVFSADPPVISIDSMWLQLDYGDQSLLGTIENGATAALSAVTNAVNDTTNALSNLLPANNLATTPPPEQPAPEEETSPAVATTPPPPTTSTVYTFDVQSRTSADVHNLSWIPAEDQQKYASSVAALTESSLPSVETTASGTLEISGSCSEMYYTILLFANAGDYRDNPSAALFNSASPCVNGSFSRTLATSDFPPNLATGTYYLVVANQGTKGPWQPFPALYPITIGTTVITIQ